MPVHQSADGVNHDFPVGTPDEVITKVMKAYAEEHRDKTSTMEQVGRGVMDPAYGLGQLASHVMPEPPPIQTMGGELAESENINLTQEGDKIIRDREAGIQKERGGSKDPDWARMTGQALNPINYIGMGAGGAAIEQGVTKIAGPAIAKGVETLASGVTGGMGSGAVQPVTDTKHFAREKLQEIGLGGLIGGTFSGVGGVAAGGLTGLGSYVARSYPENLTSEAVTKVLKRIKQDQKAGGPSATDALDLVEAANKPPESIRSSAIRHNGKVYEGALHSDAYEEASKSTGLSFGDVIAKTRPMDSGFITNSGRYVDREEAARIANAAEQTTHPVESLAGEHLPNNYFANKSGGAGKPLALVDVGGENLKGLGGNVTRQPGESRAIASAFLNKRDEEAAKRLSADIQQHVSGGPTVFQATEGLLESRSMASAPIYKQAHELQNVWSPRLEQFLSDPALKTGLQRGYEIERMQSLARGEPLTATQMGVDIGVDGSTKVLGVPNVRVLDMGKQGLDAMIADERNEITGRLSARGVALDQMRQAYVKAIDEADKSGVYKKARETWAGYSASLDALKLGRTVFGASPEENFANVAKMSPADREFYRMGVADLLKERLSKGGFTGDESKQLVKNPWMRDQLRPAFKDKADFDSFIEAVTTERQMFDTKGATVGNSLSAGRLAEDAVSNNENVGRLAQFGAMMAAGHPIKAISGMWKAYQDLGMKPNPELNEKVAQILFSTKVPEDAIRMLRKGMAQKASNPMEGPAGDVSSMSATMGTGAATAAGDLVGDRQAAQ